MPRGRASQLSRRERQIMDVLYAKGRATGAEIREGIADPPSYSAVRALLRILETKGHIRHEQDGPRYTYLPTVPHGTARRRALKHLLNTFFKGSPEGAVAALLEMDSISGTELDRMAKMIRKARREGR